jgi:hypothetical protein
MAKLDRPLYGDEATGTLARVLSFRRTENPPDAPGDPAVYWGTVAKIPFMSCRPSSAQAMHRADYAAALAAWKALDPAGRAFYNENKPARLTGLNFFLRLWFLSDLAYFGFCVFGSAWFQVAVDPGQPAAGDYDQNFPAAVDEFPTILDGAHSPQAWLYNRACSAMQSIQQYLLDNKTAIEA